MDHPADRPRSTGLGTQRTFSGPSLREVAFPLGGIGTGTVSLGGRGNVRDWEIFNRPGKGTHLPFTFFALWAKAEGDQANAWVLERKLLPPYAASHGLAPSSLGGLPRLDEARFSGAYPLAHIAFTDRRLPLQVELEAFNPFIPLNADDSGLPVAIFFWRLHNPGSAPVEATVACSLLNAVGYDGASPLDRGRRSPLFGGNLNLWAQAPRLSGINMLRPGSDGSLAVASTWPATTHLLHWERSGWFDDIQNFWDSFRSLGRLPGRLAAPPSPDGETDVGTLGLVATLPPGATVELPFILAWHFPNLTNYWNPEPEVHGRRLGNYYTTRFAGAWEAARYTAENLDRLTRETRLYHDTLFSSTLPPAVLDAASSQSSTLRTTTCLRTEDGRLHGFEGCHDNAGCCPMDCSHVWNYEQTVAHLFPDLERTMRLTDFGVNTMPSGEQKFRTLLPITSGVLWNYQPAADGQMGSILKLYREWQMSGDEAFLRALWPQAKRALAFAWEYWDADRDGVMEGEQHNTYDVEFYGPNSMMGTLYLAALRAGAEMAQHLGEQLLAADLTRIYRSGQRKLDETLWNGEYYVQHVTPVQEIQSRRGLYDPRYVSPAPEGEDTPRYQFGPGCLADQMLGQWFAHVIGLGHLLPEDHVRQALASVFHHNWSTNLEQHHNCQRTYALNDEAGLLLCTWPRGGRPRYPFPYADEVWTGIEYQVAAHLIYEGLVDGGLRIVEGARARHDGIARNPWDEYECGRHYARAMSSWSLVLALSGYHYSAPQQRLGFAPRVQAQDFRCFFSTGSGWGLYTQQVGAAHLTCSYEVRYGRLPVAVLQAAAPGALPIGRAAASGIDGAAVAGVSTQDGQVDITLRAPLVIEAGQRLTLRLAP